ncbi:superoxide dismutase family protein [Psychrobacter sp. I-STPA6b]|uniref:superoxide dismutase family protein n=1 Tax=Psychrobacter sp. I-STPA6b TaxID=2585718 RepID=UPI001D0C8D0D|nr:superoxide dismutase family protein [Psychrobacter sp. I-STPA6b]
MRTLKTSTLLLGSTLVSATLLSGCQNIQNQIKPAQPLNEPELQATIQSVDGNQANIGQMHLSQVAEGVRVYGQINNLQPNTTYAIHIHETGSCDDAGHTAGGHFNPDNNPHGHPDDPNSHAGDLPNITADANGTATMDYIKKGLTVDMNSKYSVYNRAFILHAHADDYTTQPTGGSGARIACGIVEKN